MTYMLPDVDPLQIITSVGGGEELEGEEGDYVSPSYVSPSYTI